MNEKKSLNFDFLEKDTTVKSDDKSDTSSSPATPKAEPVSKTQEDKIPFIEFFKEYYTDFSKFCEKYLTKSNPKYFLLVGWLVGMGLAADRISDSTSWGEVWGIVIGGGILAGTIGYWIQGWFYSVRIGWSKGKLSDDTAKHIWLYSTLPVAVVSILSLIFNMIAYGSDYFDYYAGDATTVSLIFALVTIVAIIYSITISYKAVRKVAKAEKARAIWWFIVAPAIFYLIIMFSSALTS